MDRFDPFVKYADVYGDIINWEKDPMNKPQNQNKYFFSDGKTYYEQICKMLRLMSVFKEAFNQIYSNEDEISEAWENFVNNLSASVVEGNEPDVTLTWTDDSVNFEFTMVPGVPGEQGVGITSISFNSDYTMTITLSDGNIYTSMSLKGETGPQGPQGETGSGLQILDVYATLADLQSAHPTGQPGDAYQVGSAGNYTLYIWSSSQSAWVPAGSLGTVSPSVSNPLMDGTASAGSSDLYSRGDHVHPSDTSRASKEELDALIKTSQSLIDQSFTYRESPAIQDGLARIDKIKGNTLGWNQLIQNGNFADTSIWSVTGSGSSFTVSNNIATINASGAYDRIQQNVEFINGHKYLIKADVKKTNANDDVRLYYGNHVGGGNYVFTNTTDWQTLSVIKTASESVTSVYPNVEGATAKLTWQQRNMMIIDLTQMGLDITDPSDFTSLFPLSYYSYNQGSLLSFNGNGIKTTGKNLLNYLNNRTTNDITFTYDESSGAYKVEGTLSSPDAWSDVGINGTVVQNYPKLRKGTYKVSGFNSRILGRLQAWYDDGSNEILIETIRGESTFTLEKNAYMFLRGHVSGTGTSYDETVYPMITFADADQTFEPYTSSTLSLPISTYFPNGMKDVPDYTNGGKIYDEMTSNKADARVGSVDLGSLNWTYDSSSPGTRFYAELVGAKKPNDTSQISNILCGNYTTVSSGEFYNQNIRDYVCALSTGGYLSIRDTTYNNVTAFTTAMSGVYLYYELAAPTETAISPELDLSFIAYENGTEQLLPVNNSVPSTSPILADMTYLSIDDAMEYIVDKLANVPQNTQQILESLEDDVADLQTDVGALQPAVSALQTSVGNINTNIGQISSTVAGHTSSISDMQSDITDLNTSLSDLEDTVTDNTSRIGTLETGLSATNGNVQNLETSVSDLDDTVTAQGTTVTALDSIIQDISNNPVAGALGSHELGFVAAYVSATLPANTGTKVTIPKPVIFPNNYTPLFIVGMNTGSYNVSICSIPHTFGNRDSVDCRVWNHGGQQTIQITVYILCMRQRQSQ